jgi:hypothetical protein
MHQEGGLYLDVDRLCNRDLSTIAPPHCRCILPQNQEWDFCQDWMMSAPGNPIYLDTIQVLLQRRRQGITNTYFLGAQTFMHVVTASICGEVFDTNPGAAAWKKIHAGLGKATFIHSQMEHPPLHTMLYEHTPDCPIQTMEDFETHKRALYAEFGLTHWTGEW